MTLTISAGDNSPIKVIIERRNKPIAVLVPLKRYEQMEELLEWIEDQALGYLAKERAHTSQS